MKNNIFYILYLMIILIGFHGCDDDEDQNQFFNPPEVFNIDASSYDNWVYFSFESGIVIDVFEPDNSMDWDIAFKRNHIKTYGGLSGVGDGCGIVDSTQIWTNESFELTVDIPDNTICQEDDVVQGNIFTYQGCYNPETHLFESCIKNPALDFWGWFDDDYYFNVNGYQFFVKGFNGNYVKFWPISYRNANGELGKISMAYQEIISNE